MTDGQWTKSEYNRSLGAFGSGELKVLSKIEIQILQKLHRSDQTLAINLFF